ncbi:MAG: shikimate kinase [Kineosporiaceae bacterium]|nr:shikimate kinase [Kineosporiaceae bacterium]MBK8076584.1 shikimate kinase [Kineosporiaceae bacterium]
MSGSSDAALPRGVVLTGLPGSGASSVARLLAQRHGLLVRDSDRDAERLLGAEVADLFVSGGEAAFREAERAVVLAALADLRAGAVPGSPAVVVVGGGALEHEQVAAALRGTTAAGVALVFLDVLLPDAARRLGWQTQAVPAGLGSPRATWQRLADQRRAQCRDLATLVISTDGFTIEQVTDLIDAQLEERTT